MPQRGSVCSLALPNVFQFASVGLVFTLSRNKKTAQEEKERRMEEERTHAVRGSEAKDSYRALSLEFSYSNRTGIKNTYHFQMRGDWGVSWQIGRSNWLVEVEGRCVKKSAPRVNPSPLITMNKYKLNLIRGRSFIERKAAGQRATTRARTRRY